MSITIGSGLNAVWLQRKKDKAIALIKEWLELCDYQVYGSISGGKDSLVMAHLIREVFPDCPFLWVNQGHLAEWDDCIELLYYLRDELKWNIIELCPPLGLMQLYRKLGMSFDGQFNALDKKQCHELLLYPLNEWAEMHNIKGYAWGLRQESRGRKEYLRSNGLLYTKKDGIVICSPIGFWTTEDIWHYIDWQKLPYATIYDVEGRMTFRNGCPIDTALSNWGRMAHLRKNYPKIYFEFAALFPEVKNYA
jgi:3'-phosphoadenosine 5'-phosphosulfate sulfotransferase (PAPS reductase)/FAD synthetase